MKTLKLVGRATGGLVMEGVAGLAGFCMGYGVFSLVAENAVAVAAGVGAAVTMVIFNRMMDLDLAALESRIAADREAELEERVAKLTAKVEYERAEFTASLASIRDAAHAQRMAELFGGLETVGSGEVDSDPFGDDDEDDEEQVFDAEEQDDIAVFARFNKNLDETEAKDEKRKAALRKQYERGLITLAECEALIEEMAI